MLPSYGNVPYQGTTNRFHVGFTFMADVSEQSEAALPETVV